MLNKQIKKKSTVVVKPNNRENSKEKMCGNLSKTFSLTFGPKKIINFP